MRSRIDGVGPRIFALCLALLACIACSSSTDAHPNVTPDGFRISVTAAPETVQVGAILTVMMIAENTTSATIMRAFPVNNFGPTPTFDAAHFSGAFDIDAGFFGDFMVFGSADTLTLAPHAQATGAWHLIATSAGTSTIVGCFPKTNDGLLPEVCFTRSVTIIAH